MFFFVAAVAAAFLLSPLPVAASPVASALAAYHGPSTLNITSLGHQDGVTTLECWQLDNPFQTTSQIGVPGTLQLQLGDVTNMSYTVVPPKFFPPQHNAPIIQYVYPPQISLPLLHLENPRPPLSAPIIPDKPILTIVTHITRYGMFLAGLAHITLPSGKHEVYIKGGIRQGLVIDTDVAANSKDGHTTAYPSDEETILIQIPIKDGIVPPHKIVHDGPCVTEDQEV